MHRPTLSYAILIALLLMMSCGCAVRRPVVELEPEPVLVHLPGIGGDTIFDRAFVRALRTGGFDADGVVYDWTKGRLPIAALQNHERNRDEAARLAESITELHRGAPDRPIYLTCESGGAGIAVFALEALPDDVEVEAVLMLAPAIDPHYDLSRALSRVRRNVLAFTSPRDAVVLGVGTRLFGTMNGTRTAAAGNVGFFAPPGADTNQYDKLIVHTYDPRWLGLYGHAGTHAGAIAPRFASGYLAPLLIDLALGQRPTSRPI